MNSDKVHRNTPVRVRRTRGNWDWTVLGINLVYSPALHVGKVYVPCPNSNWSATILLNSSTDVPLLVDHIFLVRGINENVASGFGRSCFDVVNRMSSRVNNDLCDRDRLRREVDQTRIALMYTFSITFCVMRSALIGEGHVPKGLTVFDIVICYWDEEG